MTNLRPLHEIAFDALHCESLKGNARTYAQAYLIPMLQLSTVSDSYGYDDGDSIVRYALSNLTSWRGEDARRIKVELKTHLAQRSRQL
jgi:hypothetical protein